MVSKSSGLIVRRSMTSIEIPSDSSFVAASPCYSALTHMDGDGKITGDLKNGHNVALAFGRY